MQEALVVLGYDLGTGGVYNDGVDGDFGPKTEDAVIEFQLDRGFNTANIDGVVGEGTHKELMRALSGQKPVFDNINGKQRNMEQKFGSNRSGSFNSKRTSNQTPVTTQVKRETRATQ